MPNTSEGFYYPDANTNIAPLETVLANMAASSNSVAQQTPRVFANYAAMVAGVPSPVGGRLAITTQGSGILWQYDGAAARWVVQNRPAFSSTTARDAAIPSPTAGIVAVIGSGGGLREYLHDGTRWRLWSGDVTSMITVGPGWNAAKLLVATVSCGVVSVAFKLTRASIWGPTGAALAITDIMTFDAALTPVADTLIVGSAVSPELSEANDFGPAGTFAVHLKSSAVAVQWYSATAYLGTGGTLHGTASWRIA